MTRLDELVERYGNLKSEVDSYKKQMDSDNAEIKSIMREDNLSEHKAGGFRAVYSEATSESFNDDMLLMKVKELWHGEGPCPYVKTVEVPDMKAIEDAIYHGEINPSDLADCKVVKKTPRLNIFKV